MEKKNNSNIKPHHKGVLNLYIYRDFDNIC